MDSSWKQLLRFGFVSDGQTLLLQHTFIAIWDRQSCWGHLGDLQHRVFPTAYFCDISTIKYFPWWGFHHLSWNAVVQIGISAGRGSFVVRLYCPSLIQSHCFHAIWTFNTLMSSLQSFMYHSLDWHLPLLETSVLVCYTYLSVWLLRLSQFTNDSHHLLNCIQMSLKWVGGLDHWDRKAWSWISPKLVSNLNRLQMV